MAAKSGAKHHAAKMTAAKVRQARKSYEVRDRNGKRKWTIVGLAAKYGIAHQTMWAILSGQTWKSVT